MNKQVRNTFFIAFALLAAVAAIYHFIGVFYKLNSSPVWRHIVFVGINVICIYGLLKRPWWFTWFFGFLVLQQLYSHGGDIIWHWRHERGIDWISIAVVLLMPFIFVLLWLDRKR